MGTMHTTVNAMFSYLSCSLENGYLIKKESSHVLRRRQELHEEEDEQVERLLVDLVHLQGLGGHVHVLRDRLAGGLNC